MSVHPHRLIVATLTTLALPAAHAALVTQDYTALYEYVLLGSTIAEDSGAPLEPGAAGDVFTQTISFAPLYEVRTETASVSYDDEVEALGFEVSMDTTSEPFVLRQDIDWQWDELASLWVAGQPLASLGQVSLSHTRTTPTLTPVSGGGGGGGGGGPQVELLSQAEIDALIEAGLDPATLGLDGFNGLTRDELQRRLYLYELELAGVTPEMLGGDPANMSRSEIEARLRTIETALAMGLDPAVLSDPQALQAALDALEQAAQDYAADNPGGGGGGVVVTPLPGGSGLMLSALAALALLRRRATRTLAGT